jgi:hypothetical protein
MVFPSNLEAESDHFALNAALEQRKPEIANCRKQALWSRWNWEDHLGKSYGIMVV